MVVIPQRRCFLIVVEVVRVGLSGCERVRWVTVALWFGVAAMQVQRHPWAGKVRLQYTVQLGVNCPQQRMVANDVVDHVDANRRAPRDLDSRAEDWKTAVAEGGSCP